jgi:hypothetical protein
MGNESNNAGLHVTEETLEQLGDSAVEAISRAIPSGRVIVLNSSRDFTGDEPSENYSSMTTDLGIAPDSVMGGALVDTFSGVAGKIGGAVPTEQTKKDDKDIHRRMREGETRFNSSEIEFQLEIKQTPDICVITIPDSEEQRSPDGQYQIGTPKGVAEYIAHLPAGSLDSEKTVGTAQDLKLWVGHHEGDHCENFGNKFYEYESDVHANYTYAQNLASGIASDPELPYNIRAHRAAAAMMGVHGDAYITNGLTPLAGESPLNEKQLSEAKDQIMEAQDRIYDRIEHQTGMTREQLAGDGINTDSEFAEDRARLVYQESKLMLEAGEFDELELPYAKKTAERFVDGVERYGHEIYNVQPEDRIYDAPEMPPQAYGMFEMPSLTAIPKPSVHGL